MDEIQIITPTSKSLSNRWLVMDYLSQHGIKVKRLSPADDTHTMKNMLHQLKGGKRHQFDCGDAASTARFLMALLAVTPAKNTLTGSDQLKRRPMGALIDALRTLGCTITCTEEEGHLPVVVEGLNTLVTRVEIDPSVSSQFVSALLMLGVALPGGISVHLTGTPVSKTYIDMTLKVMAQAGIRCTMADNDTTYRVEHNIPMCEAVSIERDWSAASYFYLAAAVNPALRLRMRGLTRSESQGDFAAHQIFARLGVETFFENDSAILEQTSPAEERLEYDFTNCPDLVPAVAVACAMLGVKARLTGVSTLRVKECDRLAALVEGLAQFGIKAQAAENELTIASDGIRDPLDRRVGVLAINSHDDHRIAMAFGALRTIYPDIQVSNPDCVNKSFPEFWEMIDRC